MTAMIRKPAVAGSFYPGSARELAAMIATMVDDSAAKADVVGLVCPHAGIIYSGPVAGATISRIRMTDTVIIMGPNHTGLGKPFAVMASGTWEIINLTQGRRLIITPGCSRVCPNREV